MITREPTKEMLAEWRAIWSCYKDRIRPNRKTGAQVLEYLQARYPLTEIFDPEARQVIADNVTMNEFLAQKLPAGAAPDPRAFYLENAGEGSRFYLPQNRDDASLWGDDVQRIFVGVDLASGFYLAEGSTLLWDEMCAFQGVDEKDLQKCVIVAQYIGALRRLNAMDRIGGQ